MRIHSIDAVDFPLTRRDYYCNRTGTMETIKIIDQFQYLLYHCSMVIIRVMAVMSFTMVSHYFLKKNGSFRKRLDSVSLRKKIFCYQK